MSAVPQFRLRDDGALPITDPSTPSVPPSGSSKTVQLLQDAIARLNSSHGDLPDHAQVVNLLAEAREALERATVITRAAEQSEGFLKEGQFDKALGALDAVLLVYPADPALVTRRRKVEDQQQAFHCAAAVRTALEQAEWLLDQDRIDLAAHFLEEKVSDLPDQPALKARLEELEALLPGWEQKRQVHATLGRVATLAQLQQWRAALTILEESLQAYPASEELIAETARVRNQFVDHERRKKLARRLELIKQKIAGQSWEQALTLLENAQQEFPGTPELNALWCDVYAALRRSECEAIVTEMRQCLADGELDLAEEVLRKGLQSFGQEPAIQALRKELQSGREYGETLQTAQILFGRRQLREAERILSKLVDENRPEAQALLDAVKGARTDADEENFCERGREKALELIQQRQFAQAADLLRNLLALFPGDSILERDLVVAQNGLDQELSEAAPAAAKKNVELQPLVIAAPLQPELQLAVQTGPADRAPVRENAPSRFRREAIVGSLSLVLISAVGVAWNFSRNSVAVSGQAAKQAGMQLPTVATLPVTKVAAGPNTATPGEALQASSLQPSAPQTFVAAAGNPRSRPRLPLQTPLRPFVPPDANQAAVQPQSSPLPLPPGTEPVISTETITTPLAGLVKPVGAPAPPPAAAPRVASTVVAKPNPAAPVGGKVTEAQVVERSQPVYPALAKQHGFLGTVRLEATIDERGAVKNVKVLSGHPILAAAARTAVLMWKYKAATLNDRPIASNTMITIRFGERSK